MEDRRDRLRVLGGLLRRLRKDAGLTGKELALRAGVTQPTISQIETGQLLPVPDTVDRLAEALGLDEVRRGELDALLARLRDEVSRLKGGLAGKESANAARLRSARRVVSFQSGMIPALLQTAEYARLVLAFGRDVDGEDVARAAAVRVGAQAVLFESGREFCFVLAEGAVRTWPGLPMLMRVQLDRLVQISTLPWVRLGVVPWSVEAPALPLHGFTVFDGGVSVVESLTGDLTLSGLDELAAHMEVFEAFAAVAVYGEGLGNLLEQVGADYQELATRLDKETYL